MAGNARKPAVSVVVALLNAALPVPVMDEAPKTLPVSWVRVVRVGGVKRNLVTDSPMLTLECWGPNEVVAEELAMEVADILENAPGGYVPYMTGDGGTAEAWISGHNEIGGPASNKDPDYPNKGRWTLTVELGIATNV